MSEEYRTITLRIPKGSEIEMTMGRQNCTHAACDDRPTLYPWGDGPRPRLGEVVGYHHRQQFWRHLIWNGTAWATIDGCEISSSEYTCYFKVPRPFD